MSLSGVKYRMFLKVLLLRAFKLARFEDIRVNEQNKIQGVLERSTSHQLTSI